MSPKPAKTKRLAHAAKSATPPDAGIFKALRALLDSLDQPAPAPAHKKRPGRPAKSRGATTPLVLHLYKSQIQWLDAYATAIESWGPENRRLSRVELIRGLLLGLAQHALDYDLPFPTEFAIRSERDLQNAIARALKSKPQARANNS